MMGAWSVRSCPDSSSKLYQRSSAPAISGTVTVRVACGWVMPAPPVPRTAPARSAARGRRVRRRSCQAGLDRQLREASQLGVALVLVLVVSGLDLGPLAVGGRLGLALGPLAVGGRLGLDLGPLAVGGRLGLALGPLVVGGLLGLALGPLAVGGRLGLDLGPLAVGGRLGLALGPLVVGGPPGLRHSAHAQLGLGGGY